MHLCRYEQKARDMQQQRACKRPANALKQEPADVFDTFYFLQALPHVVEGQLIDAEAWPILTRGSSVTLEGFQEEPQFTTSLMQPPPKATHDQAVHRRDTVASEPSGE